MVLSLNYPLLLFKKERSSGISCLARSLLNQRSEILLLWLGRGLRRAGPQDRGPVRSVGGVDRASAAPRPRVYRRGLGLGYTRPRCIADRPDVSSSSAPLRPASPRPWRAARSPPRRAPRPLMSWTTPSPTRWAGRPDWPRTSSLPARAARRSNAGVGCRDAALPERMGRMPVAELPPGRPGFVRLAG